MKTDRDLGVYTDNNINFNDLYLIDIYWSNNGTGTDSHTKLNFLNPQRSATDWLAAWSNGSNYSAAWGHYYLDPDQTYDGNDSWAEYAGTVAKTRGLEFEISNRGGWVPINYFYIENMDYYRAIIPFDRLVAPGTSYYQITNGIEFEKDGFLYSIVLADTGAGGIGTIKNTSIKGFYINSDLKVIVKPITQATSDKVPTALYLVDSASNVHNQSLPATGVGSAFVRTDLGYVTNIKLETMNSANDSAKHYNRVISGKYTNNALRNKETDKYLRFSIATTQIKTVNVVYDNAKELIENSGYTAREVISSIIGFKDLKTIYSGIDLPEDFRYGFGEINYSSMVFNTKPTLLKGKNVNIKILGTDFNQSEGTHTFTWSNSLTSGSSITIILSDPNQKKFDPIPTVSKVGNIVVDDDYYTNFQFHRDYYLANGFSKLRFENVHKADMNGFSNGGLIFNIDFTDHNLYPPKATDAKTYFKVVVKKVDNTGKSTQELVTFVHEADTETTGNVIYSTKGPKVSKYEIKRVAKNSYQIALQSKFDYAKSTQAGQLFIGGENIVVEVYDMDTLSNIQNNKSATKRIKTISGDNTVSILPQMPSDELKTDNLSLFY